MKYLISFTLVLLLFSCEDNVTEIEEFDLLFISSEGNLVLVMDLLKCLRDRKDSDCRKCR